MMQATDDRRATVLILDDERSIADLLGELLDTRGYSATTCGSGAEAIDLLGHTDFDLVISDLRMPEMNGADFYRLAVGKKPGLARRIIFMTGDSVSEENHSFLQSSGAPHLSKPFKLAAVERLVAETLQRNSFS